jgi:hypothetical protein
MEFMGISVGILALICALVLLFGRQSTRKILGWGFGVLIFGGLCLGVVAWALSSYQQHNAGETTKATMATPLGILSAPPTDGAKSYPNEILVEGPDHRTFRFAAGTETSAIESYFKAQYGGPGTPRGDCWSKEPGPRCQHRALK